MNTTTEPAVSVLSHKARRKMLHSLAQFGADVEPFRRLPDAALTEVVRLATSLDRAAGYPGTTPPATRHDAAGKFWDRHKYDLAKLPLLRSARTRNEFIRNALRMPERDFQSVFQEHLP